MSSKSCDVKRTLVDLIHQISDVPWLFSKEPSRNFKRKRKLPFEKMIVTLLCMEGGSLATELMKQFGCRTDLVTASAFVQQRGKILPEAFETLFALFADTLDDSPVYNGYRLFAADGSDIQIPTNPDDPDSYFSASNGGSPYNLLHLDAMYDLLQRTYVDASVVGDHKSNERGILCSMVDRSPLQNVLLIADRGYENYNLMAHIQEKGWKYLIRVKDIDSHCGIASGLDLPDQDEFDMPVSLFLTTKQTNEVKNLLKNRNQYKLVSSNMIFDYLPKENRKHLPAEFYKLPFRLVRFKITDSTYETVVTNLDADAFSSAELKKLYAMRWGIETSFRELKYTIGLLHFHAKKVEYILQEICARLIMYNFSELITSSVVIQNANRKYAYKANFSVAVHICRQFFLGNVSPPDVETLISRFISPIRLGRSRPRNVAAKKAVSFTYRIA